MAFEDYWTGKGVDFKAIWTDYEQGSGYVSKFSSIEVYFLQLSFKRFAPNQPLFNLEAILKTSKGVFHNLKQSYLSPTEYDRVGPLFVYDIARGSERWRFLGELKPLLLFAIAIWDQMRMGTTRHKAERIALIDGLQRRFPLAGLQDILAFVDSLPGPDERVALEKLYGQDLKSVEISAVPFRGDIAHTERALLSLDDVASGGERRNI